MRKPWMDDTGARVKGQNWYTHIVCNPFYTVYFTKPRKDRLTVLQVLWGDHPLSFCLDELAFAYLEQCGLSKSKRKALSHLPQEQMLTQTEFETLLKEHGPELGPQQYKWVLEAAAIAAYHTQDEFPIVLLLLCDDAGQFKRITELLALCWVHDGRHYKKLSPTIDYYRIETLFSDKKSRGFQINKSHLSNPARLARLFIATSLAYIWIVCLGLQVVQVGRTDLIDRADRIDKSLFRLGLDWLTYLLKWGKPFTVQFRSHRDANLRSQFIRPARATGWQ